MKTAKRILIAYDASPCAEAAIEELKIAGLPSEAQALVLTVADVFVPPEDSGGAPVPAAAAPVMRGWEEAESAIEAAFKTAEEGARKVRRMFPKWEVGSDAFADSPPWGVIKKASQWKADLIVAGAHGMHSTSRLAFGSLSQLVVTQAPCSVRVVHGKPEDTVSAPRIVVGIDGSKGSYNALNEVASRNWKKGAAVHLITVIDPRMMTAIFSSDRALRKMLEKTPEDRWVRRLIDHAVNKLKSRGFAVTMFDKEGDPKKILLDEARRWGADCIFAGVRGLSGIRHSLVGSVSSSLAARADCTVEVVRNK